MIYRNPTSRNTATKQSSIQKICQKIDRAAHDKRVIE